MYVSFVCGVVTSAWYTMLQVLQFPLGGQVYLLRQLHAAVIDSVIWLFWWFVNLGFVVAGDNAFFIAHIAVAQRYSVAIEDFPQWVGFREMLVN